MKYLKYYIVFFLLSILCISCEDNRGDSQRHRDKQNLIGEWAGTYTGQEDNGTITIYILGSGGGGTVAMTSNRGTTEKFRCFVNEYGNIEGQSKTQPLSIKGSLHTKKGSWKRGNAIGEWSVSKITHN